MRRIRLAHLVAVSLIALAVTAGDLTGVSAMRSPKSTLPRVIKIGQITDLTGPYSVYGVMQVQDFKAGLAYATNGTFRVDGRRIQTFQYSDVAGTANLPDPATAVTKAKLALTQDNVTILQCCPSSASALAVAQIMPQYKKILMVAPAAADGLSGINRYTFRTSREDSQDARTGAAYAVQKFGKNYMTMAQDYAFGRNQVQTWTTQLTARGATNAGDIFFPLTATDFTPYIQQIQAKKPQWLFVACAGTQCVGLFKQLASSGLLDQVKVMTGLPNIAAIPAFGDAGAKMGFISVYYYKFPRTKANTYLVKYIRKRYQRPADIFDQDAFAAAQQIVAAIKKTHSVKTSTLIKALEGQTVQGPKGAYTIRKQDHVALQPMYVTRLVLKNGTLVPVLLATKSPRATAPPLQAHFR